MSTVPFDTLKLTRTLREKAHFTQEQAEGVTEALSEAFEERIATKQDISDLKHSIDGDISAFKNDVSQELSDLKHDVALLEQRLTNKIDRMTVVLGTIVIAVMSAATLFIKFIHI